MRYLGGKSRTRKCIAEILRELRKGRPYFEPFCGACWVTQEMDGERTASDGNHALIVMYQALQAGWIPPSSVSEEEYRSIKMRMDKEDPVTAFVGIGCSFGGKWFAGYARSGVRNYALNAHRSILSVLPLIKDVSFIHGKYNEHSPKGCLVYCDPPYTGHEKYTAVKDFSADVFWETMRMWSKDNTVVVSEYQAPSDFRCIGEFQTKTDLRVGDKRVDRVERLFTV